MTAVSNASLRKWVSSYAGVIQGILRGVLTTGEEMVDEVNRAGVIQGTLRGVLTGSTVRRVGL